MSGHRTDQDIGNPTEFTMLELAELVLKMTRSKSKLVFKPLPSDDPRQRQPDISLCSRTAWVVPDNRT